MDEDIDKVLSPDSPLTAEWRGDLLGGVMVIKGKFADGSPLMAIPNYARTNRDKELPLEGALPIRGRWCGTPGPASAHVGGLDSEGVMES